MPCHIYCCYYKAWIPVPDHDKRGIGLSPIIKFKSPKAQRPGSLYQSLMLGLLDSCLSKIHLTYIQFRWPFYFSWHKEVKSVNLHLRLDLSLQKILRSHFWHHFSPVSEIIMCLSSATHTDQRNPFCLHAHTLSEMYLSPENTAFPEAISSGGCFVFHSPCTAQAEEGQKVGCCPFCLSCFQCFLHISYLRPPVLNLRP